MQLLEVLLEARFAVGASLAPTGADWSADVFADSASGRFSTIAFGGEREDSK
jgi:hypothetical protein